MIKSAITQPITPALRSPFGRMVGSVAPPMSEPPVIDPEAELAELIELLSSNDASGSFYLMDRAVALNQQLMYQETFRTTPVVEAGQPIAWVRDLLGNGNHATQSISSARSTSFPAKMDGGDDHFTAAGGFGVGDFAMCFAIDTARLTNNSVIASNYSSNSGFILYGSTSLGAANGNLRLWTDVDAEIAVGPDLRGGGKRVISVSRTGSTYKLRVDRQTVAEASGSTNSLLRNTLFLGRRGGNTPDCLSADFIAATFYDQATVNKLEKVEAYFASLL
jgi:hypothetical protein